CRRATFDGADGWSRTTKHFGLLTTASAALRWLRRLFLMPQPPLLVQEGSSLAKDTPSRLARSEWRNGTCDLKRRPQNSEAIQVSEYYICIGILHVHSRNPLKPHNRSIRSKCLTRNAEVPDSCTPSLGSSLQPHTCGSHLEPAAFGRRPEK